MISKDEVWALAQGIEEDRVEKTTSIKLSNSQVRDKYGEAICAFANDLPAHNKPGYLLIGVSNDGTLSGLKVEDRLLQSLMDFRTDGRIVPPPSMSVAKFGYDTGDVAVVEVMPHQLPPVRYEHRVHIGIGPRRAQANEQDERILNEKRSSHVTHFDAQPCMESSLEDISQEIFQNTYLPNAVSPEILQENHREPFNQLASLKFFDLKNNKPTNAGILMFGKNPMFFLPGAYIQYVRFEGNTRRVINGPFTDTKELLAGFWMWRVKSMEEAIEWVKRIPNPMGPGVTTEVEIRPVFESADFGEQMTPELHAQEDRLRAETEKLKRKSA